MMVTQPFLGIQIVGQHVSLEPFDAFKSSLTKGTNLSVMSKVTIAGVTWIDSLGVLRGRLGNVSIVAGQHQPG